MPNARRPSKAKGNQVRHAIIFDDEKITSLSLALHDLCSDVSFGAFYVTVSNWLKENDRAADKGSVGKAE